MRSTVRLLACTAFLAFAAPAYSQEAPPPEEEAEGIPEEHNRGDITVSGTRVRQGGAQDIRHFRSLAADVGMPGPESLTVEGLTGEHDLDLTSGRKCAQLFCLATEAMAARLPGRPDDRLFVGLNEKQIHFPEDGLVFDYRSSGDRLKLKHALGQATVYLRRVASDPVS